MSWKPGWRSERADDESAVRNVEVDAERYERDLGRSLTAEELGALYEIELLTQRQWGEYRRILNDREKSEGRELTGTEAGKIVGQVRLRYEIPLSEAVDVRAQELGRELSLVERAEIAKRLRLEARCRGADGAEVVGG